MMRVVLRSRVCLALVFLALPGCKQKTQLNTDAVDSSLVVSLERGACRGRCPVYRVEVYGDGKVQFDGKQYVGSMGTQNGTVPVADVQALLKEIQSSEFSAMDTSYVMGSAGCGQYYTDLPMSILSAKVGAQMKTVHHDPGCQGAPRFLQTLAAKVDSVAHTAQWISGNGDAAK